ncbi:MAG: SMI1/KNR4 family protein [Pseudomonadota bacterium]
MNDGDRFGANHLIAVTYESIVLAELALGYRLPEQLRQFYIELGYGFITRGQRGQTSSVNRICHPQELYEIVAGTFEGLLPDFELQPATLPFFERDTSLFLCLRPESDQPIAVHWMWGGKICDSLVDFFQRLVEDPDWFNPLA